MPAETRARTAPHPSQEDSEAQRAEWIAAVEQIISDAETWAAEQHWFVHRGPKTITEEPFGSYEAPTLLIQAPAGRFILEPYARFAIGTRGAIELSVFPSYESVLVVRDDSGWHFVIERPTFDRPWSKDAFLEIVSRLAKRA